MVNQTVQLKPEQISRIIRSQIKYYENAIEQTETGTVTMVGDGIARAAGLDNCMAGELVQFESGTYGMAQNLEENSVSIVLLGDDEGIKEGSTIKAHRQGRFRAGGRGYDWPRGHALGQPIDGKVPSRLPTTAPLSPRHPASWIVSPSSSLCRPALRPSTR